VPCDSSSNWPVLTQFDESWHPICGPTRPLVVKFPQGVVVLEVEGRRKYSHSGITDCGAGVALEV
jgi:hypothetical protein